MGGGGKGAHNAGFAHWFAFAFVLAFDCVGYVLEVVEEGVEDELAMRVEFRDLMGRLDLDGVGAGVVLEEEEDLEADLVDLDFDLDFESVSESDEESDESVSASEESESVSDSLLLLLVSSDLFLVFLSFFRSFSLVCFLLSSFLVPFLLLLLLAVAFASGSVSEDASESEFDSDSELEVLAAFGFVLLSFSSEPFFLFSLASSFSC